MSKSGDTDAERLLRAALGGDARACSELLERFRPYVALLARLHNHRQFQSKADHSDLVQETMLRAHAEFAEFRGGSERELAAWLRSIMAYVCANIVRHYTRQQRDVRLERSLHDQLDETSLAFGGALVDRDSSPSQKAMRRERAVLLTEALDRPPSDYREVLILREFEGLKMPAIAARMGRSTGSVEKLWARALVKVRRLLKDDP